MSPRDAAVLLFVGLGIVAGLSSVTLLQASTLLLRGAGGGVLARLVALVPTIFLGWAAVHLIRRRAHLAHTLFPHAGTPSGPMDRRSATVLGLTLLGLYVLITSAQDLMTWVAAAAGAVQHSGATPDSPLEPGTAAAALVRPSLGAIVFLNRERLAAHLVGATPRTEAEVQAPEDVE